ncbi:MAG TPA: diguanylate cyclase [Candidatus Cryosericum sp.]|jgi:diguanylate cyclase (GGDEF)-like protein|nr:diguanylate cyclase [Candidatus Cryosericum sp.]
MLNAASLYMELYAILACIVLIMLGDMLRSPEKNTLYQIFTIMLRCMLADICAEAAGWLANGHGGAFPRAVVTLADGAVMVLTVTMSLLWLGYVVYYVTRDGQLLRRYAVPAGVLLAGVTLLTATAPLNGWVFTVDAGNAYHRGPLFLVHALLAYGALAYATVFVLRNAYRIPRRQLVPLLAFPLLPIIGGVLQMAFYGLSTTEAGTVLGLLLVYVSLQSLLKGTDYMTGLANRRQLDAVMERVVANPQPAHPTAVLMVDVDNLKAINDTWGHDMGDLAIRQCAAILRRCFHYDDTVARYAGDEFFVVLRLERPEDITAVLARLDETARRMATPEGAPFSISISVGCALYPSPGITTVKDLYRAADRSMYEAKRRAHAEL